jgi:hypothetical protein
MVFHLDEVILTLTAGAFAAKSGELALKSNQLPNLKTGNPTSTMKTTNFMERLLSNLRVRVSNIKSQLLIFMSKNWLFVKYFSTVERGPTLSAGYKFPQGSVSCTYCRI